MIDRLLVGAVILFGALAAATSPLPRTGLPAIFLILTLGAAITLAGHRLERRHP